MRAMAGKDSDVINVTQDFYVFDTEINESGPPGSLGDDLLLQEIEGTLGERRGAPYPHHHAAYLFCQKDVISGFA
jgi:hypothetical protein